jgi:hypothetical protein
MPDPTLDRAAAILRSRGRIAMTTAELAAALADAAGTVAVLERRLADDERFVVFDTGAELPGLEAWDHGDRLAYAAALRQVDLPRPPLVLLRDDRDPPGRPAWPASPAEPGAPFTPATSVSRLLHHTVIALADTRSGPLMAMAAEETCTALSRVNPPTSRTALSTIPPPGPPPPA